MKIIKEFIKHFPSAQIKYYQLKCDCGNIIERNKSRHDKNPDSTCGKGACNNHIKKMIGKRFGRLTLISHHSREKGYNCLCDCGNATIARTFALKQGRHSSCGCLQKEQVALRNFKGVIRSQKHIYNQYKSNAKKRNLIFNLTLDEFINLIESPCFYCGATNSMTHNPIRTISESEEYKYNGVDRINNGIGYIKTNCVSCCKICNNSKASLNLKEWKAWIKKVYTRL